MPAPALLDRDLLVRQPVPAQEIHRPVLVARRDAQLVAAVRHHLVEVPEKVDVGRVEDVDQDAHGSGGLAGCDVGPVRDREHACAQRGRDHCPKY
jgi:hypothetical protein